ncbi:hypothetical protein [Promicromonospora sp. NFX87]|uniref:hypothetical protein n=1 Tax=Promicromonospora sp. NFX87 TaxID=3402691 RepID=UPI003AFACB65
MSSLFDRIQKKGTPVSVNDAPGSEQGVPPRVWLVLFAGAVLVIAWGLTDSAEVAIGAAALAVQLAEMIVRSPF